MPATRPSLPLQIGPPTREDLLRKGTTILGYAYRARKHHLHGNHKRAAFFAGALGEQFGILWGSLPERTIRRTVPTKGGTATLRLTLPALPGDDQATLPSPPTNEELTSRALSIIFGAFWTRRQHRRGHHKRALLWSFWTGEQWGRLGRGLIVRLSQSAWLARKVEEWVENKLAREMDNAGGPRRASFFDEPTSRPSTSSFGQPGTGKIVRVGQRFSSNNDYAPPEVSQRRYVTVACVSEAHEGTEFGAQPWPAVWYSYEGGNGEVISAHCNDFLRQFSPADRA